MKITGSSQENFAKTTQNQKPVKNSDLNVQDSVNISTTGSDSNKSEKTPEPQFTTPSPQVTEKLSSSAKNTLSQIRKLRYYEDWKKTGAKSLEDMKEELPSDSLESLIINAAIKPKGPQTGAIAIETTLKALGTGIQGPMGTALSSIGKDLINHRFQYYSHCIEAAQPFMEAIHSKAPKGSANAVLAKAALDVPDNDQKKYVAMDIVFNQMKKPKSEDPVESLATAGKKVMDYSFKYYNQILETAKPFLEGIKANSDVNSIEYSLASGALSTGGNEQEKFYSWKRSLDMILSKKSASHLETLAKTGLNLMSDNLKYYSSYITATQGYINEIAKASQPGSPEEALANASKRTKDTDKPGYMVRKTILEHISSGNKLPVSKTLAHVGLKAMTTTDYRYYKEMNEAGRPFIETLAKNNDDNTSAILAKAALEVKGETQQTVAYQSVMKVISSEDRVPYNTALAKAGLKIMESKLGTVEDYQNTVKPFLKAIARNKGYSITSKKAKELLKGKADYKTLKQGFQEMASVLEKAESTIEMVEKFQEDQKGKADGSRKSIKVEENTVNIGGVTLSRANIKKE